MEPLATQVKKLLELAGFEEPAVSIDAEARKLEIFLNEGEWLKRWLPGLINDLEQLVKLLSRKAEQAAIFIDINNYRKERERLIVELAKAAARKASTEKETVKLPAMNAYERRLVHLELSVHPEVKTESEGEGRERCVVIKPI